MRKYLFFLWLALPLFAEVNARTAPYSATGDGVSDDTAALNAALLAASISKETVYVPGGTYVHSALTIYDKTHLRGDGERTVFLTKAGSNSDAMVTDGAYALFGSGSLSGVSEVILENFVIDGNKANNSSGGGLIAYWSRPRVENVIIRNTKNRGIRSEWGNGGYPSPNRSMEGRFINVKVSDCDDASDSWLHNGPHDSVFFDCATISGIGFAGIHVGPAGNGSVFTNCHPWGYIQIGRSPQWQVVFDGANSHWLGSYAEGGSTGQILLRASGCSVVGGEQYNIVNSYNEKGIQIGDAANGYTNISGTRIDTRLTNFFNGGIVFDSEYGLSRIDVIGWNSIAGSAPWVGAVAATTHFMAKIGGPGGGFIYKLPALQTSPSGLPSGSLWNNAGVLSLVP